MSKKELVATDYGFNGIKNILNKHDINYASWIARQIHKERGGIELYTPNVEGEIYLTWGDIYHIKLTTVHTKKTFDSIVNLNELQQMLVMLEEQRQRTKKGIADMLMKAFSKDEEE